MVKLHPLVFSVTTTATATATTTSNWYPLDYKYQENAFDRGFVMTLASVSNQSWTLQVGASAPDSNGNVDTFYNVSTWTATSVDGVLTGNWPSVRFIHKGSGAPSETATFILTR